MSNKLEDFFNQLAGEDILQKMRDEEQAKLDEEKKKIAEENEKEIQKKLEVKKIEEKKKLTEDQKLKALEQLFGLPKFDEIVKEEVEKIEEEIKPKKSVDEEALLQSLAELTGSIGEYQKKKVIEYDITENDYKKYLKSKPTGDDTIISDITKLLDQSYIPEQLKVNPPEKQLDVKYLNTKKENVYNPLPSGMVNDVKAFIESKVDPQPYMKMNVGDPIKPGQQYVNKDEIYRTLTKRAKSLKEQLENGEIGLEELSKEFSRFKQLTTLQLQSIGGGGSTKIGEMDDIDYSSKQDGYALKWNASSGKYDFGEVAVSFAAVDENIIPDGDGTRDLGSLSKAWNNAYFKNLYVEGTTTQIDTVNATVKDKLFELGTGITGTPSGDIGLVLERGDENNVFIGYDESEDEITFGTGTFTGSSTGDLSLTDANIRAANITATGNLDVTGSSTLRGNVTLGVNSGDSTEDTITVNGRFISNLEPLNTTTYDLGSPNRRWRDIYLSGNTIDLAGATISGDGTGAIQISATGATLPAGSKVGANVIAQADAKTGISTKSVPLYTQASGLSTAATTFTMAAGSSKASVFTAFTKANGQVQSKFELFSF